MPSADEDAVKWSVCSSCPLNGRKRVDGRGNIESGIWFVGEAPGREEEISGQPFVGGSGKILQAAIDKLGLQDGEYYITNIVQCRPSDAQGRNRPPTVTEKECCSAYLEEKLLSHNPRVVVLLGNHAVRQFISNKVSTSTDTGKWIYDENFKTIFFVMLHPAATLYNPNLKTLWETSFDKIKGAIADAVSIRLSGSSDDE
jgi:DNA polymerase